jgi:RimJ/RimL family protein N-acetyltransferase
VVPVIETERLRLRGHTVADFDAYAEMWSDPEVTRHIGGKPYARDESWLRFLRYPGQWALVGYGYWLIEEKASGRYVGEAGFGAFKREIDPPLPGPEQGWVIAPWAQGRGYASEAVAAELAWGERHFGPDAAFVCMIDPDNAVSIRVAQKHGYREFARTSFKGAASILFRRQPS